jgi:hypothetical protein
MFVRVENFGIESKSKREFEEGDIHVVIIVESTYVTHHCFESKLVPMFFHMDSIGIFKSSSPNWSSTTIIIIVVSVKGGGNNKGEK